MKDTAVNSHHAEIIPGKTPTTLAERFEQFGYACIQERCEKFTRLRFTPKEEKLKDFKSQIVFNIPN